MCVSVWVGVCLCGSVCMCVLMYVWVLWVCVSVWVCVRVLVYVCVCVWLTTLNKFKIDEAKVCQCVCVCVYTTNRVRTGHENLEKSWNSEIKIPQIVRCYKLLTFCDIYSAN